MLNCWKEMVLPAPTASARVGPTCGKLLQRKELTAKHPPYLAVVSFVCHLSCGLESFNDKRGWNNERYGNCGGTQTQPASTPGKSAKDGIASNLPAKTASA